MGRKVETVAPWKYTAEEQAVVLDFLRRMERQFSQGLTSALKMRRAEANRHTTAQVSYYRNAKAAIADAVNRVSQWQHHSRATEGPLTDE